MRVGSCSNLLGETCRAVLLKLESTDPMASAKPFLWVLQSLPRKKTPFKAYYLCTLTAAFLILGVLRRITLNNCGGARLMQKEKFMSLTMLYLLHEVGGCNAFVVVFCDICTWAYILKDCVLDEVELTWHMSSTFFLFLSERYERHTFDAAC